MKRIWIGLAIFLTYFGEAIAIDEAKYQQLETNQKILDDQIRTQEEMINDDNLFFIKDGAQIRALRLVDYVEYLLLRMRGNNTDQVMNSISEVAKQTADYRRVVREQIIPEKRRELASVRAEMRDMVASNDDNRFPNAAELFPWHMSEADRLISGHWVLSLNNKDSIIYVTLHPEKKYFSGTIMVDHLRYFNQGDVMFIVSPKQDNPAQFEGTEYGYDEQGMKKSSPLVIWVKGGEMTYDNGEQLLYLKKR